MKKSKQQRQEARIMAQLRSEIYQWFAQVLSKELTKEEIQIYQDGALNTIFELFVEIGLSLEVERFQTAITKLADLTHPELELKADFAACFLLDEQSGAMPYASLYLSEDGMMYSEAERKMRELLSKSGLMILESFKEPSDHLAIYLSLLQKWCQQLRDEIEHESNISEYLHNEYLAQRTFINDGILLWLPNWHDRLSRITHCQTGFYQAFGVLLLAFLFAEKDFLEHELQNR